MRGDYVIECGAKYQGAVKEAVRVIGGGEPFVIKARAEFKMPEKVTTGRERRRERRKKERRKL